MPLRAPKGKWSGPRLIIVAVLLLAILQIEGCYYMQAIRGQYEVMNRRQPIAEVIADEESPDDLKKRLTIVQEARVFAVDRLLLADNESYQSYADLGRDYVLWNVFAAPEFSLEPKTWCYPVAGWQKHREVTANRFVTKVLEILRAANRAVRRIRTGSSTNASETCRRVLDSMSARPLHGSINFPSASIASALIVRSLRARSSSMVTSGAVWNVKP